MGSPIVASNNINNNNINITQPEETSPGLPESVLQILKDLGCEPPEGLASLDYDVAKLRAARMRLIKPSLTDLLYSVAILALTIAAIAAYIFGQFHLGYLLAALLSFVCIKFRSSEDSLNEAEAKIEKTRKSVNIWLRKILEMDKQNLSPLQRQAVENAYFLTPLHLVENWAKLRGERD